MNFVVPQIAEKLQRTGTFFGGWVVSSIEIMKNEKAHKLCVVTEEKISESFHTIIEDVEYYILPKQKRKSLAKSNGHEKILQEFSPDVIHIFGTEYDFGINFFPYWKGPVIISVQGVIKYCSRFYDGGLYDIRNWGSLRYPLQFITKKIISIQHKRFNKRLAFEKEYFSRAQIVIGRTEMDKMYAYSENQNIHYQYCSEPLREIFYNDSWNIELIERNTIFVGNTALPLKGLHILLQAVCIVRKTYPSIKVYIAGDSHLRSMNFNIKNWFGYSLLIRKMIKKLNLEKHIIFTGLLDAEKMKYFLKKANVFVLCSAAENSPNTLGEAMLLDVTSVSSCTGGTVSLANDQDETLFYRYEDIIQLAEQIKKILREDDFAQKLSEAARLRAKKNHNYATIEKSLLSIYNEVSCFFKDN